MENKETLLQQMSNAYTYMKSKKRSHNEYKRLMSAARSYNDRRGNAISTLGNRVNQFTSQKATNGFERGITIRDAFRGKVSWAYTLEASWLHKQMLELYEAGEATEIDIQRANLLKNKIDEIDIYINDEDYLYMDFMQEASFNVFQTEDINQLISFLSQKFFDIGYSIQIEELRVLDADRKLLMAADLWINHQAEINSEITNISNLIDQLDPQSPSYQEDLQNYQGDLAVTQQVLVDREKEYNKFVGEYEAMKTFSFSKTQHWTNELSSPHIQLYVNSVSTPFNNGVYGQLGLPTRAELEVLRGKCSCFSSGIIDFFADFTFNLFGNTYTLNAGQITNDLKDKSTQLQVVANAINELNTNIKGSIDSINEDYDSYFSSQYYDSAFNNINKDIFDVESEILGIQTYITTLNAVIIAQEESYNQDLTYYNEIVAIRDSYNTLTSSISDVESAISGLDTESVTYSEDLAVLEAQLSQLNTDRAEVLPQNMTIEGVLMDIYYKNQDLEIYNQMQPLRISNLSETETLLASKIAYKDTKLAELVTTESYFAQYIDELKQTLDSQKLAIQNYKLEYVLSFNHYTPAKTALIDKLQTQLILD